MKKDSPTSRPYITLIMIYMEKKYIYICFDCISEVWSMERREISQSKKLVAIKCHGCLYWSVLASIKGAAVNSTYGPPTAQMKMNGKNATECVGVYMCVYMECHYVSSLSPFQIMLGYEQPKKVLLHQHLYWREWFIIWNCNSLKYVIIPSLRVYKQLGS